MASPETAATDINMRAAYSLTAENVQDDSRQDGGLALITVEDLDHLEEDWEAVSRSRILFSLAHYAAVTRADLGSTIEAHHEDRPGVFDTLRECEANVDIVSRLLALLESAERSEMARCRAGPAVFLLDAELHRRRHKILPFWCDQGAFLDDGGFQMFLEATDRRDEIRVAITPDDYWTARWAGVEQQGCGLTSFGACWLDVPLDAAAARFAKQLKLVSGSRK